jgi:N-acyl homoserine lactone hydrolase
MDLSVDAYELGTFRFPEPDLKGRRGVVMGFAIHHPEGVIVVDTGFGFGHPELDQAYDVRAGRILDALAGIDVRPPDVTAVINCHLHADHAGQNLAFPNVPILVQPVEWRLAHDTDHTILEWVDFDGADIRPTPGDHEVRSGVRILATPGHTAGHQSVTIDTPDGLVVLAGQACYTTGEWAGDPEALEGRSSAPDVAAYDASLERLRELRPTRVHFGHDRETWAAKPGS